ncbi:MAG: AI-2E family transporter [Thermomicrobiales bacterium]|nr:AI-2E family transporter [Thermomicrobiales bacterium]
MSGAPHDPRDALTSPAPASLRAPVRTAEPEPPRERRPGLTPISLLITLIVGYLLYQIQVLVVLVLLAIVFATVIERPVHLLEQRRTPRPIGILIIYAAFIGGVALLFTLLAPVIRDQSAVFRAQMPEQLRALQDAWAHSSNALLNGPGQELLGRGVDLVKNPEQARITGLPGEAALGVITGVGGGIVSLFSIFVIAFYYLMEKAWLRRVVLLQLPMESRPRVSRLWDSVEGKVGDWLRGQLVLCLVIGSAATIGYGVMGIRFWPLLGLWAGVTEIIPILGPWLGGVPAVVVALTQGWDKALMVTLFVVALQLAENTILVPRVMRGAVGLSPMTVFLAILAGTQVGGIAGALLAIPLAAALQVVLSDHFASRKETRREDAAPVWRWMRGAHPQTVAEAAPSEPAAAPPRAAWPGERLVRSGKTVKPPPE